LLHDGGCPFHAWAPFASVLAIRLCDGFGATRDVALARDSAQGYGDECWSA
jgi:hypothetical protein